MKKFKTALLVGAMAAVGLIMPQESIAAQKIDKLIVLGDSLSDDGGDNSTWYLLKTLNGQTGEAGLQHMQPWVRSWLSETIPGYEWSCSWSWVPCKTTERTALKGVIKLLSASGAVPVAPAEHYDNGRWSNGPMWPEYLAGKMGISVSDKNRYRNISHAGGWSLCVGDKSLSIRDLTGDIATVAQNMVNGSLIPPCLKLMAKGYNYKYGNYGKNDLVVVFFGGNDYLNRFQDPARVVAAQLEVIQDAVEKGAKNIAWLNMPDISQTPRFLTGGAQNHAEETSKLIETHNVIQKAFGSLFQIFYKQQGVNLINIDANKIFRDILDNSSSHGLFVLDRPCSTIPAPGLDDIEIVENNPSFNAINEMAEPNGGICESQDEYAFWDGVHPTTATHRIIADKACEILKEKGYQCNI
ncbi:hypothetical protein D5R81_06625 [Parashewanella spongiae]|uniref:SGNH/GDSL hydrolase family protein n=1 Tax=Parashewanella spongiae TaxID=342950 RepID=A0A3A6U8C8_9GAMM|nr:SGNH/GDSL hydrolase family protein [Parashewanella spongiae]MCL1077781.1 SGNH/GDSL hydrolase family protein [Parashewanella spongiae]RJY18178.1 hypothetical protein D5R81_06625 [Parashewanella spongiae]